MTTTTSTWECTRCGRIVEAHHAAAEVWHPCPNLRFRSTSMVRTTLTYSGRRRPEFRNRRTECPDAHRPGDDDATANEIDAVDDAHPQGAHDP